MAQQAPDNHKKAVEHHASQDSATALFSAPLSFSFSNSEKP